MVKSKYFLVYSDESRADRANCIYKIDSEISASQFLRYYTFFRINLIPSFKLIQNPSQSFLSYNHIFNIADNAVFNFYELFLTGSAYQHSWIDAHYKSEVLFNRVIFFYEELF